MGLLMDDLHSPSVLSGPATGKHSSDKPKEDVPLLELMAEKQQMEEELKALGSVLDSHGVNMNTSLTTFDGFPRNDIDVAQIRTTRAQIIRLRNDYKSIMSKIEAGLHAHHATLRNTTVPPPSELNSGSREASSNGTSNSGFPQTPFARINSVVSGSPADEAGLRAGDRIRLFGAVNWMNHEKLSKVAEVVQESEGRTILVTISREEPSGDSGPRDMQLQLIPRRNWGGRGLLGCHLLPL